MDTSLQYLVNKTESIDTIFSMISRMELSDDTIEKLFGVSKRRLRCLKRRRKDRITSAEIYQYIRILTWIASNREDKRAFAVWSIIKKADRNTPGNRHLI